MPTTGPPCPGPCKHPSFHPAWLRPHLSLHSTKGFLCFVVFFPMNPYNPGGVGGGCDHPHFVDEETEAE